MNRNQGFELPSFIKMVDVMEDQIPNTEEGAHLHLDDRLAERLDHLAIFSEGSKFNEFGTFLRKILFELIYFGSTFK